MKVSLIALAAALVAFTTSSDVQFSNGNNIRASQNSDNSILVQWSTTVEEGVGYFSIEQASQQDPSNYYEVGRVKADGAGTAYQYVVSGIYKTTSSEVFVYRVSAVDDAGNVIARSNVAAVDFGFSSSLSSVAKRTWGSIKAMFR